MDEEDCQYCGNPKSEGKCQFCRSYSKNKPTPKVSSPQNSNPHSQMDIPEIPKDAAGKPVAGPGSDDWEETKRRILRRKKTA